MAKLYFYVVYWRNNNFLRTRFKPNKAGHIFGMKKPAQRYCGCWCRCGLHEKTGTFRIVEKYAYLGRMSKSQFKKWILKEEV